MKIELEPFQRSALRALAHSLNPVVMIGNNGLSDVVMREIDINLNVHELIKIRVSGQEREERAALLETLCHRLSAAPVQLIGHILILWRPGDKQRIQLPAPRRHRKTA